MIVTSISLRNFRNIESLEWTPAPGISVIGGQNGAGKTSLLEAIHFGMLGRSFRTRRDEDCLRWHQTDDETAGTRVQVTMAQPDGRERSHEIVISREGKHVTRDGLTVNRLGDLWEGMSALTFVPEDVDLFRDFPARRRRALDMTLSQRSPLYLDALRRYQGALREANALMKLGEERARDTRDQACAFYAQLAEWGAILMEMRSRHILDVSPIAREIHLQLGGSAELKLDYHPSIESNGEELERPVIGKLIEEKLIDRHTDNARARTIRQGPHRDDLRARREDRDLARFGSQGQQRLAALSLTLATAELLRRRDEAPILLLDDFGSELDPCIRGKVINGLRGQMQVIITATDPAELAPSDLFDEIRRMGNGRLLD